MATTIVSPNSAGWTDLGVAPLGVQLLTPMAATLLRLQASDPTSAAVDGGVLSSDTPSASFGADFAGQHVWARAVYANAAPRLAVFG